MTNDRRDKFNYYLDIAETVKIGEYNLIRYIGNTSQVRKKGYYE